jgi:hypothetical protein
LDRTFREAEQAGLRIAIKGRLVALVLLGAYLVVSRIANPEHALELGLGIAGFAALGLIHYPLIGSRHDRVWLKYAFITLDIAVLSLLMATQPIFDTVDVPQALSFRNPVFPFYFVILGVAAFSFSPGLVLWSGIMGAAGWLGAFAWAVRDMPVRFDWSDIGTTPTTEHFLSIFLSPDFIGTGSRIQESVAYLVVAALIAAVMWRARRTVRRQLELDEEQRALTDVFGRYVPRAIADALISDRGLLEPVEGTATVLFIDVAGFTKMTEASGPRRVVGVLNAFFDRATAIINGYDGVVTQFIGDAIMATFNLPAEDPDHAAKAVSAALAIADLAATESGDRTCDRRQRRRRRPTDLFALRRYRQSRRAPRGAQQGAWHPGSDRRGHRSAPRRCARAGNRPRRRARLFRAGGGLRPRSRDRRQIGPRCRAGRMSRDAIVIGQRSATTDHEVTKPDPER